MPRIGQEPVRRAALMAATVEEIGRAGSLDVTVGQIARRAGMSSALAHHYFGGKTQIFLATMRQILRVYGEEVRRAVALAPRNVRVEAIVAANFSESCFAPTTVAAWLNFYVLAQTEPEAARLLKIYRRRLRSNLMHALVGRASDRRAVADDIAALIDGVYLRRVLSDGDVRGASVQVMRVANALMRPGS